MGGSSSDSHPRSAMRENVAAATARALRRKAKLSPLA